MTENETDNRLYHVVVNHEEQYSVWLVGREVPRGWRTLGDPAPKQDCLDRIADLWVDMRPLSLRLRMEQAR